MCAPATSPLDALSHPHSRGRLGHCSKAGVRTPVTNAREAVGVCVRREWRKSKSGRDEGRKLFVHDCFLISRPGSSEVVWISDGFLRPQVQWATLSRTCLCWKERDKSVLSFLLLRQRVCSLDWKDKEIKNSSSNIKKKWIGVSLLLYLLLRRGLCAIQNFLFVVTCASKLFASIATSQVPLKKKF